MDPVSRVAGAVRGRRNDLVDRALARQLVWPSAEQLGPVAEPIAGHVVVSHLNNELWPQRLPFDAALRAPTARPARGLAGKPRSRPQSAKLLSQR
jgi:hypothetical protein